MTKLLNWGLGKSLLYVSEDSLDPDLCGIKTNRVNIFLAVYIPDLNISKHVKLTFLHRSLQGPCRFQLPRNPDELDLLGRGCPWRQAKLRAACRKECLTAVATVPGRGGLPSRRCACYLLISTGTEGGSLPSLNICTYSPRCAKHLP